MSYMSVEVMREAGYEQALSALALCRNQPLDKMPSVLAKLAGMGGGHDKVLEMMCVWVRVDAPRHWWQEMATYRVGTVWCSESTMWAMRGLRGEELLAAKDTIYEGSQQTRIGCLNYQSLRRIYHQRKDHRLPLWGDFCAQLAEQLEHKKLVTGGGE